MALRRQMGLVPGTGQLRITLYDNVRIEKGGPAGRHDYGVYCRNVCMLVA